MHDADADRLRIARIVECERERLAFEAQSAGVGLRHAAENPHQRALARAVAADETQDLAARDVERNVGVGCGRSRRIS